MTVSSKSPALLLALGPGWHELEDNHVWSTDEAKLRLPVPNDCGENECSAVLILSTFGASTARPVKILFLGETQEMISPDPVFLSDNEWHSVSVPLSTGKTSQVLIIQVPNAISPSNLLGSLDPRVLGVALRAIELRRM
jgi:hypothetical protein